MQKTPRPSKTARRVWSIVAGAAVIVVLTVWLWPRDSQTQPFVAPTDETVFADRDMEAGLSPEAALSEPAQPASPGRFVPESHSAQDAGEPVEIKTAGGETVQLEPGELPQHLIDFQKTIDEYFAAPEHERVALLDKHIDEMMAFTDHVGLGGKLDWDVEDGGDAPPGGPRSVTIEVNQSAGTREVTIDGEPLDHKQMRQMHKQYLEEGDPEMRARISEYTRAVRERMRERGIDGQIMMMAITKEEDK